MRFPLADWIDGHLDCRHNLGSSGMIGTITHPEPTAREVAHASEAELIARLAEEVGVARERLFLTPGATEANAWVTIFHARRRGARAPVARVRFPEYPPLTDGARWAGFLVRPRAERADLALVSQPRNPEGTLWSRSEFDTWSSGARAVLVDETFRLFAGTPSLARRGRRGVWTTGSFTKFFAGDDVRVGFVVAPPEAAADFARFHGIVTDELPPHSVASASRILDEGPALPAHVRRVFEHHRAILARARPRGAEIRAPVYFDRVPDGDALARRCLRASVLVSPGSFFGDRRGVRITLTRRTFSRDLAAYLRVASGGR